LNDALKNHSSQQVFHNHGFGAKRITSIAAIKQELMNNGPIVSTSFVPRCSRPMANHPVSLITTSSPEKHPVLIIGWGREDFFEYWLAKRLSDGTPSNGASEPLKIGMKQFNVEEECVVPEGDFENISWQPGPYFDAIRLPKSWMNSPA
jgi:hypothetical protein